MHKKSKKCTHIFITEPRKDVPLGRPKLQCNDSIKMDLKNMVRVCGKGKGTP
jgi:hypothetical protein